MSAGAKAVFLSYASQDAEAARRMADALRAAGVEVWFDQNELVGGDAWDAKIRKQIKECALFLPIISAATQARTEGYFRLEWRLADQRTHLMAKGRAFLLPVVIDDTRDAEAHVPDSFTEVQWTRLPQGNTPPAFVSRVNKLLGLGVAPVSDRGSGEDETTPARRRPAPPRRTTLSWMWVAVAVVVLGGLVLRQPWKRPAPSGAPPPGSAPLLLSEAQQLARRAIATADKLSYSRDELIAAEDMAKRATDLERGSALAWGARAWTSATFVLRTWDISAKRRQETETLARRALALDPDQVEALNALGEVMNRQTAFAEAERLARKAISLRPGHRRSLNLLSRTLANQGRTTEERAVLLAQIERDSTDVIARYALASSYVVGHRPTRTDLVLGLEQIDAALAVVKFGSALFLKASWLVSWKGDLAGMRAALDELARLPVTEQTEDQPFFIALWGGLLERKPERVLAIAALTTNPYIEHAAVAAPTAWYTAMARVLAKQSGLARTQWQAAEAVLRERIAAGSAPPVVSAQLAVTLAWLGKSDEAAGIAATLEPIARESNFAYLNLLLGTYYAALGDAGHAVPFLRPGLNRSARLTDYTLPLDPWFDKIRGQPEFEALLAEAAERRQAEAAEQRTEGGGPRADQANAQPAGVADAKSVAVLAFANLSDDASNEYFSDGISEELLTVLQKIPGLRVAARTSAFSFKNKNMTAQEIGEKLGVAHLVEGSVRKAGNSVRIMARLSRAATGEQIWSESYTRELKDVFAVQSELAQTILEQLRGQLGGAAAPVAKAEIQAQVQAAQRGGTKIPEAHQLYLQGTYFVNRLTVESAIRAGDLLGKAVEIDPGFALAWAAMSRAGWVRSAFGETKEDFEAGIKMAREAAARAVAAEPDLAAAHLARAAVLGNHDFDWKGAAAALQRATALAPNDPAVIAYAAELAATYGDTERAVVLYRQAVALDPVNPWLRAQLGFALSSTKRFDESKAEFQRVIELSPTAPWGHGGVSMILTAQGRFPEAVAEAEKESARWCRLFVLAIARWGQKQTAASDAALQELIDSSADVSAVQVAWAAAFRRDNERAFEWLERAYRQRDGGLSWSRANFLLENLKTDPRWPVFLRKMGLADEQLK